MLKMVKNIKGLPKYIDSGTLSIGGLSYHFVIQENLGKDL